MNLNFRIIWPENFSDSVINLLKKCLEKNPLKRYKIDDIFIHSWVAKNSESFINDTKSHEDFILGIDNIYDEEMN